MGTRSIRNDSKIAGRPSTAGTRVAAGIIAYTAGDFSNSRNDNKKAINSRNVSKKMPGKNRDASNGLGTSNSRAPAIRTQEMNC